MRAHCARVTLALTVEEYAIVDSQKRRPKHWLQRKTVSILFPTAFGRSANGAPEDYERLYENSCASRIVQAYSDD
jgi:hypothetical protein